MTAKKATGPTPGRAILYVRVSALMGRGGDDFHSPAVQLAAMRRMIAINGFGEVDTAEDIDRTGRNFTREGIDKVRRMAESGAIDAMAVYDVSRFGRNVRESLGMLNWLADHGVTVISACEQIDTSSPAGRLMLTNMLAIAEYRSDEIGRSWKAAIDRRAERGEHHGKPLGYTRRRGGPLEVDPVLGPAVTEVFRAYAAGEPISRITKAFAATRGTTMHTANLKKLLYRHVYLGLVVSGGRIMPGNHQPLTDKDTWQTVQDRLARDRTTPARNLEVKWALVGLVFCPDGHRLQRTPMRHRTTEEITHRLCCGLGPSRGVSGGCVGIGFPPMVEVEAEVLRQVGEYVSLLRADDEVVRGRWQQRVAVEVDQDRVNRDLAQVRAKMAKVAEEWVNNRMPEAAYRPLMDKLVASEKLLEEQAAAAASSKRQAPEPREMVELGQYVVARWLDMDHVQRNRVLRQVVRRVVVRRATRWREPVDQRVRVVEWVL